jgi:hypothetical protein
MGDERHPEDQERRLVLDLQTIVGGTGDFTGASGSIQAFGTFDSATGTGSSGFVGTVCSA